VFHCCEKDGIRRCYNTNRKQAKKYTRRLQRNGSVPTPIHEKSTPDTAADDSSIHLSGESAGVSGLDGIIKKASHEHDVPETLIRAVIHVESRFKPDAISPVGAQGLMQLMPVTADFLDVMDPFDPRENVMAGTRLLRRLANRFNGDLELTLAAYFAGPSAVLRAGGIPTRQCAAYVSEVLERYQELGSGDR